MSIPPDGIAFSLKHVASGLYLGIKYNARFAGGEAVLVSAVDNPRPRWFLRAEQDSKYLINASAPALCLNVAYESTKPGGILQQWNCNSGASELWTFLPASSGNFSLKNKNSGLVAGTNANKADWPVSQIHAADSIWHLWRFVELDYELAPPLPSSTQNIVLPRSSTTRYDQSALCGEMIYNIYIPIYSFSGHLNAVIQDLPRILELGFSIILLMPIHPIGIPIGSHPSVGSPYAVADYYGIEPNLGSLSDFLSLVNQAHSWGLKIVLDVVLNHTAWNHPFITQRPAWYVHHTNGKERNSTTISQAFWFEDVAQLDYKSGSAVQEYMSAMLLWWMKNYHVDGFRFDTVDNPYGQDRMIPASTWSFIGKNLKALNPRVILLGECTDPELSLKPFNIDYTNYSLQPALMSTARSQDASDLSRVFFDLKSKHPTGMLHTSIMQTWDMDLDLSMYGGPDETLVAAVFNFCIEGVPMLFAGEEAGNERGGINTHTHVSWHGLHSHRFLAFYKSLGSLRRGSTALRRGSTIWLHMGNANPGLAVFIRRSEVQECLIAINFSASSSQCHIGEWPSSGWTEVSPPGAAYPATHPLPPSISLGPWDFAIFTQVVYEDLSDD